MDIVSKWTNFLKNIRLKDHGQQISLSLFLSMIVLLWFFVGSFMYYHYNREKEFRVKLLTTELLQLNEVIATKTTPQDNGFSVSFDFGDRKSQFQNLRITIMDNEGNVRWDNREPNASLLHNHKDRPEVQQALSGGTGYIIRRNSETLGEEYFYVASYFPDKETLIRSALPYDLKLVNILQADKGFIWFSLCVTLVLTLVFYRQTRILGGMINRLHEEENNRIKRQLSQNMSHELKTPVSSIQGYVETILRNPKMDEKQRNQFLNRCHVQTKRLTNILRDINTLNRIDEAPEQLEKISLDLVPLIDGIVGDVQILLAEHKMDVIIELPDEIPMMGNEGLLYSVFRNLFDNSIAYAGDGATIQLTCLGENGNSWHFQYSDNGVGISDEHLPNIFNRFYRVDKGRSRRIGGTGLGLAIVKNAVLFHGGTISVHHAPASGLLFNFTLSP